MKKIYIISLVISVLLSCNIQKYDNQMPTDFSFRINNETDSYDSKTGVFTRKYVGKDSTVNILLTKDEMILIYEVFKKKDFMSFPNEFECDKNGGGTLPAFDTTIEIIYNGKHKSVTNTTYCDKKIEQKKSDKFNEFESEIMKIIKNKPEIKRMRNCDMIFM